jgi:hypothetical protein
VCVCVPACLYMRVCRACGGGGHVRSINVDHLCAHVHMIESPAAHLIAGSKSGLPGLAGLTRSMPLRDGVWLDG